MLGDISRYRCAIGAATRTSTMLAAMTGAGKTRFADCLTDMALC
jgi:hypothetical protein